MKLKDMFEAVDLLATEWDLGKTISQANGKICAWIYLMEILSVSEKIIFEKDKNKIIGFCGYASFNSKKHLLKKKVYCLIKKLLFLSPAIKDKKNLKSYHANYNYTPPELEKHFDGEISIIIVDKNYRGKGIGKKMLLKVFNFAQQDGIKVLQILSDASCDFRFYEILGCKKVYETVIQNYEPMRCNGTQAIGYIYEKDL
jgi:ribosomal protein S18 acetylase RimI-like enzyme